MRLRKSSGWKSLRIIRRAICGICHIRIATGEVFEDIAADFPALYDLEAIREALKAA